MHLYVWSLQNMPFFVARYWSCWRFGLSQNVAILAPPSRVCSLHGGCRSCSEWKVHKSWHLDTKIQTVEISLLEQFKANVPPKKRKKERNKNDAHLHDRKKAWPTFPAVSHHFAHVVSKNQCLGQKKGLNRQVRTDRDLSRVTRMHRVTSSAGRL